MPNTLQPVEGDFPSCIAQAALNFGEVQGSPTDVIEHLEQIANNCSVTSEEGDLCLMAPVASSIGLIALTSRTEQWWLTNQLSARRVKYPAMLLGHEVSGQGTTECLEYTEPPIAVTVGEDPVVDVVSGQSFFSLVHTQTRGNPVRGLVTWMSYYKLNEGAKDRATPQEIALAGLNEIVCAGMVDGKPGVKASVKFDGDTVSITDKIDGLILHGNTRRELMSTRHPIPTDRIVLPWPRTRTFDIKLSDADVYAYSHRV